MSTDSIHNLDDREAKTVLDHLVKIKNLAEALGLNGSSIGFEIYREARDALEIVAFDTVSRNALRALKTDHDPTFRGWPVSSVVLDYIKNGQRINAIKEFRGETGLGLKEAKDWVEAYIDHNRINLAPF